MERSESDYFLTCPSQAAGASVKRAPERTMMLFRTGQPESEWPQSELALGKARHPEYYLNTARHQALWSARNRLSYCGPNKNNRRSYEHQNCCNSAAWQLPRS